MLLNKALKGEQREKGLYVNRGGMLVSRYQNVHRQILLPYRMKIYTEINLAT